MLNNFVILGKVKEVIAGKGDQPSYVIVEADRAFRNIDGSYSIDVFKVDVWRGIAEEVKDICQPGQIIGIKGRLEADPDTNVRIIAEKISYVI